MGYVIQQSPSPAPHNVCSTASTVSIGAWTHILMIYENSTIKLYINGSEVCSSYKPSITINTTGNSGISIGLSLQANGNWGPFDGKIDDIRIYNRALNQSEITYLSKN